MDEVDVLIIGGGPSGSTLAALLAAGGRAVGVVERSEFPRRKVCGEYLSPTNLSILDGLGLGAQFNELAGPEIQRVAIFVGKRSIISHMPVSKAGLPSYGRALRREVLDTLLLECAARRRAKVWQPYSAIAITRRHDHTVVTLRSRETHDTIQIRTADLVIAHGSWDVSELETQRRLPSAPDDLMGFKAHYRDSTLPQDLMPMIVFPGGYGGMVTADNGFVSLSCCVRRDAIDEIRAESGGSSRGEAIERHIFHNCSGVADVLKNAERAGEWLSAGVIRPGIRSGYSNGIFFVGNAAGESHPIIAEGISMAIRSAHLLSKCFLDVGQPDDRSTVDEIGAKYNRLWSNEFRSRIRVAEIAARAAMSGTARAVLGPLFSTFPSILSAGARFAGKLNR